MTYHVVPRNLPEGCQATRDTRSLWPSMSATGSSLRQPERECMRSGPEIHSALIKKRRHHNHTGHLVSYLSRFHSLTEPSAAHEARLTSASSRETVACGRKTIAPTLVLCPSANHGAALKKEQSRLGFSGRLHRFTRMDKRMGRWIDKSTLLIPS